MKFSNGWYLPDHEQHLQQWMSHPKNQVTMNGRQAYQGRKQQAALELCKQFRTAVDVGAHVGFWTYNLACRFGMVHSFEPLAEHRDCFYQNVTHQNVRLHPIALGAAPGSVSISTEIGSSGNSAVSGPGKIEMVTLDSLRLENVDFIKIDCEGYEENVCRGAAETIARCRPVIVVEQKKDMAQRMGLARLGAVHFLETLGYGVAQEISGDYFCIPTA